jgi:DNA repair protein RAD51
MSTQKQRQEDEVSEEKDGPMEISALETQGITATLIKKLELAGFHSVESVSFAHKKKIMSVRGISIANAEKIIEAATKLVPFQFTTATEYETKKRTLSYKLTTGSQEMDKLLGGGIESDSITEVFGEARSGKTQLCHTICVACQLPLEQGGGAGKALYIDTEGTFRPEKVRVIADRFGLDSQDVLENILHARAMNSEQQTKLLVQAGALMTESRYAVIIVDSCTSMFRTDYTGRGELSDRQIALNQFLKQLSRMAIEFNVPVLVTNQVMATVDNIERETPSTVVQMRGL